MSNSPAALKAEARKCFRESKPPAINVGMLLLVLILLANVLAGNILANRAGDLVTRFQSIKTPEDYTAYVQSIAELPAAELEELWERVMPTTQDILIIALLFFMVTCVRTGYILFLLNTIRKTKPAFGNLLDCFAIFYRVLGLIVFGAIALTVGLTLFVIPGVILFYAYRMAPYIMLDHPELSVIGCMHESRIMMKGHKFELFRLDISFIIWWALKQIPLISYGVRVWTIPFTGLSRALFYESVRRDEAYDGLAREPNIAIPDENARDDAQK